MRIINYTFNVHLHFWVLYFQNICSLFQVFSHYRNHCISHNNILLFRYFSITNLPSFKTTYQKPPWRSQCLQTSMSALFSVWKCLYPLPDKWNISSQPVLSASSPCKKDCTRLVHKENVSTIGGLHCLALCPDSTQRWQHRGNGAKPLTSQPGSLRRNVLGFHQPFQRHKGAPFMPAS